MPTLADPLDLGPFRLPHRVVMAPMTRCRAGPGFLPTPLMATYYQQRASPHAGASLIITEAAQISPQAQGYPDTPGIYTDHHARAWNAVTDAVHAVGGRIVLQLWHVGRMSHPDFQPGHALPVAPSALSPGGEARVNAQGLKKPRVTPRALEPHEIPAIIDDYRRAATLAKAAGFDGVEIHGANGYLPDQFLRSSSNHRTDDYGGSIENRARFLLEATDAAIDVWGPRRVGVRLSPSGEYSGMADATPRETFGHAVRQLGQRPLSYLHVMRSLATDPAVLAREIPIAFFRSIYPGVLIANARYTRDDAERDLREGVADAIAFGVPFIANPDLFRRFELQRQGRHAPLADADPATYYGGDARGYTDYPPLP